MYCYIHSQKWDAENISNISLWDRNVKKINHSEGGFTYSLFLKDINKLVKKNFQHNKL